MSRRRSNSETRSIARLTITSIMGVVGPVKAIPRRVWPHIFSVGLGVALVYLLASALPAALRRELYWVGVVAVMAVGALILMRFGRRESAVSMQKSVVHEGQVPKAAAPRTAIGLAGLTIPTASRIVPRSAVVVPAKSASAQPIASPTASTGSERARVAAAASSHSEQLLRDLESLRSRPNERSEPVAKAAVSVQAPERVSVKSMRPQALNVPARPPNAPASMSSRLGSEELQIALMELRASHSARLPRAKPAVVVGQPVLARPPATDLAAAPTRHPEAREAPTTCVVLPAAGIHGATGQKVSAATRSVADVAMEVPTESQATRSEEKAESVNRSNFHERGFAIPPPFVKESEPEEPPEPTPLVVPQPLVHRGERFVDHQIVSIAKQVLKEVRAERLAALAGALQRVARARDCALPSSSPVSPRPVTSPPIELAAPIEPTSIASSASTHAQGFRVPQAPGPQRIRDIVVDLDAALAELEARAPTAQPKPASPRAQPDPKVAVTSTLAAKRPSFVLDMSRVASIRDHSLPVVGTGFDDEGEPAVKVETPIDGETAKNLTPEIQAPRSQAPAHSKPKSVAVNPPTSPLTVDLARVARLQEESREVESLLNGATTDGLPLAEDYSNAKKIEGLIEGKFGQFGAQLLGAVVIILVIGGIAYAFFSIQNKLTKGGIRSSHEDEVNGLDMPEMGVEAYVD